ncbi:ATP-dependent nuclease [Phaeobacter inhibens]|uniref:ATP-dependent nuclease n=1 Tax=Phaeobacter inhibens TaxID=221822 RepID=UPI0021A9172D|nr:AAA family ATPase [Phaeobacter inhibens]UWR88057.1 AAA family ATPase [Phaeobacter inhibens]
MSSSILKLMIRNFRGVQELEWHPSVGMNIILGGGDTGKTTVLEAVDLLFSPSTSYNVSETDYWMRETATSFTIEAVVRLGDEIDINTQPNMAYPWHWNGEEAVVPDNNEENGENDEVYRVRFTANDQQETLWEIVQPDGSTIRFSVGLRRQIGLVSLPSDDRNDKDLRLVYGSALDRHIGDPSLRSRIGKQVAGINLQDELSDEAKEALAALDTKFGEKALPGGVSIGLTSSKGISIGALVGLLARKNADTQLPLSSWGAGTRRLASLEIGASNTNAPSFITVDEIERGLEPYRLRQFLADLSGQDGQKFITTHSPIAIASAPEAQLWYMDSSGRLGSLPSELVGKQQKNDPETFLSRVAVIAEGVTEVGFLNHLLELALGSAPLGHGIRVCNGQGNDHTRKLLKALQEAGLKFAGLADNEGVKTDSWAALKKKMGDLLLQWEEGCTEEAVILAIPDDQIPALIGAEGSDQAGTRLQHLKVRSGAEERTLDSINAALDGTGKTLKQLVIEAASGSSENAPDAQKKAWKSHSSSWFKSEAGGAELAKNAIALGGWSDLSVRLLPLITAILASVELTVSEKLANA